MENFFYKKIVCVSQELLKKYKGDEFQIGEFVKLINCPNEIYEILDIQTPNTGGDIYTVCSPTMKCTMLAFKKHLIKIKQPCKFKVGDVVMARSCKWTITEIKYHTGQWIYSISGGVKQKPYNIKINENEIALYTEPKFKVGDILIKDNTERLQVKQSFIVGCEWKYETTNIFGKQIYVGETSNLKKQRIPAFDFVVYKYMSDTLIIKDINESGDIIQYNLIYTRNKKEYTLPNIPEHVLVKAPTPKFKINDTVKNGGKRYFITGRMLYGHNEWSYEICDTQNIICVYESQLQSDTTSFEPEIKSYVKIDDIKEWKCDVSVQFNSNSTPIFIETITLKDLEPKKIIFDSIPMQEAVDVFYGQIIVKVNDTETYYIPIMSDCNNTILITGNTFTLGDIGKPLLKAIRSEYGK